MNTFTTKQPTPFRPGIFSLLMFFLIFAQAFPARRAQGQAKQRETDVITWIAKL
jgi:hypothetical protein